MGRTMRSVGGTQSALLAFGLAVFQASPLAREYRLLRRLALLYLIATFRTIEQ